MTGREAIRFVADHRQDRGTVRRLHGARSTSATLRRMCDIFLTDPAAFEELSVLVSAQPEIQPVKSAAIAMQFTEWTSLDAVARQLGMSALVVSDRLSKCKKRGYQVLRRMGPHGLEWRAIPQTEGTPA